jgi:hypothetical protein
MTDTLEKPARHPFGVEYHQRKVVVVRKPREGFLGLGAVREGAAGKAWIASLDSARRELELPPGHPLVDQVYAAHPLQARRYLPVAQFHRAIFEEKVHEFMRLLAALGATRIRYTCAEGFRRSQQAKVSLEIPLGPKVGPALGQSDGRTQEAFFEEVYEVRRPPFIPDDLVWFGHELSWRELARRRLEVGTRSFRASLLHEDSYGIERSVLLGIEDIGVELGARFEEFRVSRWEFEGEFASLNPSAPAPVPAPAPARTSEPAPVSALTPVATAPPPLVSSAPPRTRVPPRAAPQGSVAPMQQAPANSAVPSAPRCPRCAGTVLATDRFCDHCGHALSAPRACPSCRTPALPTERFCSACGFSL